MNLSDVEAGVEAGAGLMACIGNDALDVLDTFRALGKTERRRVQVFVHDALMRQQHPDAARLFDVTEAFQSFIDAYVTGEGQEATCRTLDLTKSQYERAWQAVKAIMEEVDAACFER